MKKIILLIFILNYSIGASQLDRRYNEQAILMTHNSTSLKSPAGNSTFISIINSLPGWLIGQDKKNSAISALDVVSSLTSGNVVADENLPVQQQLKDGVRGFKIPLHLFSNGGIYICHTLSKDQLKSEIDSRLNSIPWWVKKLPGISHAIENIVIPLSNDPCLLDRTYQRFVSFLQEINNFLNANPNEIVTLFLDTYGLDTASEDIQNKARAAFDESGLTDKIFFDAAINDGQLWPTLSEMIGKNKRLVIFASHDLWQNLGVFDLYKVGARTNYTYKTVQELDNDSNNPVIDAGTPGPNKVFFIDNYTTPLIAGSESDAKIVNQYDRLWHRFSQYQNKFGYRPNILMVDFYELPSQNAMQFINNWNSTF
jgi:hypothetical protein